MATQGETGGSSSSRKVLEILLAYSAERTELSVPEMSEAIGASIPSTYRYLSLLKSLDLLVEGRPGRYHPTARMIPIARAAQLTNALAQVAAPLLKEAMEKIGETVMLMQQSGEVLVCTAVAECRHSMRFTIPQGRIVPFGQGASGKMAAALAADAGHPRGNLSADASREIEQILAQGYATSVSEIDEGAWACSFPVLTVPNDLAVLSCAGPESRMSAEVQARAKETLRESAARMSELASGMVL